jgi:riboflavin kinase/FMN adenylyltransferase
MGMFDGVHLGHQKLIHALCKKARAVEGEAIVVTFHPHPREVLHATARKADLPRNLPLTTAREKAALLEQLGVDCLIRIPFTEEFSQLSGQTFIHRILVGQIGVKHLIVGHDHHFGHNREGDTALLQAAGVRHGFSVQEISPVVMDDAPVSTTRIRRLLLAGDVKKASEYLGRPYESKPSS